MGVLAIVAGCVGMSIFGMLSFGFGLIMASDTSAQVAFGLSMIVTLLSAVSLAYGIECRKTLDRAKRYAKICGQKMYARIAQLASATGISERKLRRDIKKMSWIILKKNWRFL